MLGLLPASFRPPLSAAALLRHYVAALPPLTWRITAGSRARGVVMVATALTECERIARTALCLAALDGVDGATVDVTSYAGGRPVATRSRVWTGGRWQTIRDRDMVRENDGEVCDG